MKSILETEYVKPNRPISLNELNTIRKELFKELNLSEIKSFHKCKHFYYVKKNGRKEKEINDKNNNYNIGNCSCCWKLHNTPIEFKNLAYDLVNTYTKNFYNEPEKLSYILTDLETTYYRWLYQDNYSTE